MYLGALTQKMQNKAPKKGKISPQKSPHQQNKIGRRASRAAQSCFCWAFWEAYVSFFGTLILHVLRIYTKKYALTIVLLLNNLAGAFARQK